MQSVVLKTVIVACAVACFNSEMARASEPAYSPYADVTYPMQVYWGDTHLHTTNSLDARTNEVTLNVEDDTGLRVANRWLQPTASPRAWHVPWISWW